MDISRTRSENGKKKGEREGGGGREKDLICTYKF